MISQTCVIIGASHAAAQLAPCLRREGWQGRIIIISDEPYIPYHRPPLSKALLSGAKTLEEVYIRPLPAYEKDKIEFMLNTRVAAIDRSNKQLELGHGTTMPYDKLALATGSRVRTVELPGIGLSGVYYLRDYSDIEQIRTRVTAGRKVVIVGGGYIGLETAATLRQVGMGVTVIEMMDRVLQRVTAPQVSKFFARIHTEEGVNIVCGAGVTAIAGDRDVHRVVSDNGSSYDADLVIIGIGIVPNIELAEAAGLEVNNGIVVDEYAATSDPDIVAAGDCTCHFNRIYDRWLRLESVQNATDQARVAAATICGTDKIYDTLPWFWSDQYDLKLQIAGLSQDYDEVVVRGDPESSRSFAAFYLKEGVIIAVDAVNKPAEFMTGKRLITKKVAVAKEKLAAEEIPARDLSA